jgi:hypothetical protein
MSLSLQMRPGSTLSYVITQNTRLWSSDKPYGVHDQKLRLWVVISRWRIVGPLFFEETVNRKRYCSMLTTL